MAEKKRCDWVDLRSQEYIDYHDNEWGVPVHDDTVLFEFLVLEGAQAGLSWLTVLRKRAEYKKAFANWDVKKVATYDEAKIQELLQNEGIIRNQLKIRSAVKNAQVFIEIQKEFGSFDKYIWKYVDYKQINNKIPSMADVPVKTEISDAISKDLKKRGMNFVGSTIMYAYMQAVGLVNDHHKGCFKYEG